jgi:hypothetical protein
LGTARALDRPLAHYPPAGRQRLSLSEFWRGAFGPTAMVACLAALLPPTPPFSDRRRRRIWQGLREEQRYYQEAKDDLALSAEERRAIGARSFSRLVRALHGSRLPWWMEDE